MRKILLGLITLMLLVSCAKEQSIAEDISASSGMTATQATQSPAVPSTALPSPNPSATGPYKSCGTGESLSKTVATDDIKLFMATPTDKLSELLGASIQTSDDPSWRYYAECDYLGISLVYRGDGYYEYKNIQKPEVPIDFIRIDNYEFRGLDEDSSFEEIMNTLGKTEIIEDTLDGNEIYYIQYFIDGLVFEFNGGADIEGITFGCDLKISPACPYKSQGEGERVSELFYTGDFEKFFTLPYKELSAKLGFGYDATIDTIECSGIGISFEYVTEEDDGYINFADEYDLVLQSIILSNFDFRGLTSSSSFQDVIHQLGDAELFVFHKGDDFYYALRYNVGGLSFDFFSPDEKGTKGIRLAVTASSDSRVFYKSCGNGESVSKTLTTGDIKLLLKYTPEDLDTIIGNGVSNFNEDTGEYRIYFEYLGTAFIYPLEEAEQGEDYIAYPVLPLECVGIDDFEFRGLDNNSTFEDVTRVLGEAKLEEIPVEDTSYFSLRYKIDDMLFDFSGSDELASDGVSLSIMPS